jgi:hypothetical protein
MSNTPNMPTVVPDYASEGNWNAFLALFPEDERANAPNYSEAAESLDKFEETSAFAGLDIRRVKVVAAEWKSWAEANRQSLSRKSIPAYAIFKFAQEATGNPDIEFNSSV